MRKKMLKISFEIILSALLIAGAIYYFNEILNHRNTQKQKVLSQPTVMAERQKSVLFREIIEGLGTGVAKESVDVTSTVTEKVSELNFEDGQHVKKGTLLVRFDDAQEQAEKRQAELDIQEQLREMNRVRTLFGAKAASQKSFDEQKTSLERARMKLDIVKAQIADRTIHAPFDGVLGTRMVSLGDLVTPGTKVTTIDDLSEIKIDFNLPEKYFSKVQTGRNVTVTTSAYPKEEFKGVISFVGPRINPTTRSVEVRAVVSNQNLKLRPGMMFTVYADMGERNALMIPEKAVMSLGEIQYVFVLNPDMRVRRIPVRLGVRKAGRVEVEGGLANGANLIVEGVAKLVDGMEVKLRKSGASVK